MATSTISNTITDPIGTAVSGALVTATLMPSGGFRSDTFTEVARTVSTTSNGSGAWSLALERNSNITPANTWYEIVEHIPAAQGGRRVWNITVGGSNQTVLAALTTVLGPASSGTYLTQASADARYQALSAIGTDTPTTIQPDDAAAAGVSTAASRGDHKHAIVAAAPSSVLLTGANAEGASTSFARADHAHIVAADAWSSYAPSNTNITVGNGTQTAKFLQIGKTVFVAYTLTWGSTTSFGGTIQIGLPVTALSATAPRAVGSVWMSDTGTNNFVGTALMINTTQVRIQSNASSVQVNATVPHTWANTDELSMSLVYEAA